MLTDKPCACEIMKEEIRSLASYMKKISLFPMLDNEVKQRLEA